MTFLIVFFSVTNIILGYALAVYLHDIRLPWQFRLIRLRRKAPTSSAPSASEGDGQANNVVNADQPGTESPGTKFDDKSNNAAILEEANKAKIGAAAVADSVNSGVTKIKAVAEPSPLSASGVDEAAATKTEDLEISESEDDEQVLAGIEAFQSELKQEEKSPRPDSEVSVEEADSPTESSSESEDHREKEPSGHEDVLKGIEAFRAQLASMQHKPAPSAEETETEAEEELSVS